MSLSDKEKPILFNTEMVKAILDGRKTQTRRIVKSKYLDEKSIEYIGRNPIYGKLLKYNFINSNIISNESNFCSVHSKIKVDDVLYVKEPCKIMTLKGCHTDKSLILVYKYRNDITNTEYEIKLPDRFYKKDNAVPDWVSWFGKTIIPSGLIKEMARIFLRVTNVRVERLQDINEYDIFNEGFALVKMPIGNKIFINNWNSTAKDGYKWEDNPYVFVYEFERLKNVI